MPVANHFSVNKSNQIKDLRKQGLSQRKIAESIGVDRKTVARHLPCEKPKGAKAPTDSDVNQADLPEPASHPKPRSASQCEPFRQAITELLKQGLHAQRIHQDLTAEHGFDGSYYSVRRFVKTLKSESPEAFRRIEVEPGPNGLISLNDSWTLYAWSHWIKRGQDDGKSLEKVVILHVDDHTDLMTPRLAMSVEDWRDSITGEVFDLTQPETVRSAVLSGAIGVGSFMSPFLHAVPRVEMRHLSKTTPTKSTQDHLITTNSIEDTILHPGGFRPAVALSKLSSAELDLVDPDSPTKRYRFTRHLRDWLAGIPDSPILLHIDMDYFNNRFDGDSDWEESASRHDPPLLSVLKSIDELFAAIDASGVSEQIEDVSVGISPRFFPAEMWRPCVEKLNDRLAPLGFGISPGGQPASNSFDASLHGRRDH